MRFLISILLLHFGFLSVFLIPRTVLSADLSCIDPVRPVADRSADLDRLNAYLDRLKKNPMVKPALQIQTLEERAKIIQGLSSSGCFQVLLKGQIQSGDAGKFHNFLRENPFVRKIKLWSEGGNIFEAMEIGTLIRERLIETSAGVYTSNLASDGKRYPTNYSACLIFDAELSDDRLSCFCASACFLVWAAGVNRDGNALGLHRPSLAEQYASTLMPDQAQADLLKGIATAKNYLANMEVSQTFRRLYT